MSEKGPKDDSPFDPEDVQSFLVLLVGTVLFVIFFLVLIPTAARWGLEPHTADQPPIPTPGWLDGTEAPASRGREIPPVDPAEVLSPTPAMLERGKSLFGPNCAACHGQTGAADGPAAKGLNPAPRNFTSADGWKNGTTLAGIFKTLSEGIPGTSMSSFDTLPPKDRMALVHAVRSMGSFDHGRDDPGALQEMAERFKSSGGRIPNRIPVSEAARLLEEEAVPPPPLPFPGENDRGPEADLLRRALVDPSRAARALAGLPRWEEDPDLFAAAAAAGAPTNGFSAGTAGLTPSQWKTLHALLVQKGTTPWGKP